MFNNSNFWGMNLIWWILWAVMLAWIFIVPYDIPGQRRKKDTPLDILQKEYASGRFTTEEYNERKRNIEINTAK